MDTLTALRMCGLLPLSEPDLPVERIRKVIHKLPTAGSRFLVTPHLGEIAIAFLYMGVYI